MKLIVRIFIIPLCIIIVIGTAETFYEEIIEDSANQISWDGSRKWNSLIYLFTQHSSQ